MARKTIAGLEQTIQSLLDERYQLYLALRSRDNSARFDQLRDWVFAKCDAVEGEFDALLEQQHIAPVREGLTNESVRAATPEVFLDYLDRQVRLADFFEQWKTLRFCLEQMDSNEM